VPDRVSVRVDGRDLALSNLDKVLYPNTGTTKAEVIDYYTRVAPVLLRHVGDRPLSLRRCPDGVEGECFFEKNCPSHRPAWVRTVRVRSGRRGGGSFIDYCVIDDRPGVVWLANLAALELHPYLHRADDVAVPSSVVFDLDPGEPAGLLEAAEASLRIRDLLTQLGLRSVVKTSGGKGMQVYLPLNRPVGYDDTTPFARAVAQALEQHRPDRYTSNMKKEVRAGRILVDWSQNNAHKTTVGAYVLRIRPEPSVSTPVSWDEVEDAVAARDRSQLQFGPRDVLGRVARQGDQFAPAEELEQELPGIAGAVG
jgi:bifunctional non-homologous end joining protein LigD